jgi:hypothetical protein
MSRAFILALLLFPMVGVAQLSLSYSMGGISLGSSQMNSFSGPVLINPDKGCMRVGNGVAVYTATSIGSSLFNPDCKSLINTSEPFFKLYPNPAPGMTRLYSNGAIAPTDLVTLLIHDLNGALVSSMQIRASQLESGFPIHTKQWASGLYLITILHKTTSSSLKFINTVF